MRHAEGKRNGTIAWALAGAGAAGGLAWLMARAFSHRRGGRPPIGESSLQANARKALALKETSRSGPKFQPSMTISDGMRPIPNQTSARSGALNQEGQRPVLERSRKVR